MNRHPVDATALIFGALFALSGFAIVSDEAWPDLDTTAVVGGAVGLIGLAIVGALVGRQLRSEVSEPTSDDEQVEETVSL